MLCARAGGRCSLEGGLQGQPECRCVQSLACQRDCHCGVAREGSGCLFFCKHTHAHLCAHAHTHGGMHVQAIWTSARRLSGGGSSRLCTGCWSHSKLPSTPWRLTKLCSARYGFQSLSANRSLSTVLSVAQVAVDLSKETLVYLIDIFNVLPQISVLL